MKSFLDKEVVAVEPKDIKPKPIHDLKLRAADPDLAGLGPSGVQAYEYWKEHCPKMFCELKEAGRLNQALQQAEERTERAMERVKQDLLLKGHTPQQVHQVAWEMVKGEWLFLSPEKA